MAVVIDLCNKSKETRAVNIYPSKITRFTPYVGGIIQNDASSQSKENYGLQKNAPTKTTTVRM